MECTDICQKKDAHPRSSGITREDLALFIFTLFFFFPVLVWGQPAPIPVVVTLPVLTDLVYKIGRDRVVVRSLITGLEGEHTYTPKPSDILAIQKAKLLVTIGLGLEGWIEPLIKNADRPDLVRVVTAHDVPLLFHRNPHIWLDPENVKIMVRNIAEGLSRIDPDFSVTYRSHAGFFMQALDRLTQEMRDQIEQIPVARRKMVTHHAAWPYFAKRFGLTIVGEIQTQIGTHGGSEPSAKQIKQLIQLIQRERVRVVVSEPQLSQKIPEILVEETGVRRVVLSPLPGVFPQTETYLDFIRYNVETLVRAMRED